MRIFIVINQSMHITPIKIYISIFITLFFKKLIFPQWNFKYEDLNSIELFLLLFTFIYTIHLLVKSLTSKKIIRNVSLSVSLLFCSIFLYNYLYSNNTILHRIQINSEEEIIIRSKDQKYCIGDLNMCTDSIKVTKYKLFQKTEIL